MLKKIDVTKLISVIILMVMIASISTVVLGASDIDIDSISRQDSEINKSVKNIAGIILSIAQTVALAVAVIMLAVLAIKYFSESPEGKSDIKKRATSYIIGAVLLFGGVGILQLLKSFAGEIK